MSSCIFNEDILLENFLSLFTFDKKCKINYVSEMINMKAFNAVLEKFFTYFKSEDAVKGSNHIEIIENFYFCNEYRTYDSILKTLSISKSTMKRYRSKYIAVLKDILVKELDPQEMEYDNNINSD